MSGSTFEMLRQPGLVKLPEKLTILTLDVYHYIMFPEEGLLGGFLTNPTGSSLHHQWVYW
jgi:hypothetical protein